MLGTALGYLLKHPLRAARSVITDPVETWLTVRDRSADRREHRMPQCRYEADVDWEHHLHDYLGAPWPCQENAEFQILWAKIIGSLRAKGLQIGPHSFGAWN